MYAYARGAAGWLLCLAVGCSLTSSLGDELTDERVPLPGRDADGDVASDAPASSALDAAARCPGASDPTLVASYTFEEDDAFKVFDCSASGLHGTLATGGTFARVPGRVGRAIEVDGEKGCFDLGPAPMIAFTDAPFTVAAWIKTRTFSVENETSNPGPRWFVSHYAVGVGGLSNGWGLGTDDTSSIEVKLFNEDKIAGEAETTGAARNVWTHVAGVRSGSTLELYVGGVLRAQSSATLPGSDPNAHGWIGCRSAFADAFFDGAIDELQIYSRALSATDIAALAQ